VYFEASSKTLTLTGNLFYGNTANNNNPVIKIHGESVSASYNVVDAAPGTGSGQSGWIGGQEKFGNDAMTE
jgi:hypothetical protein